MFTQKFPSSITLEAALSASQTLGSMILSCRRQKESILHWESSISYLAPFLQAKKFHFSRQSSFLQMVFIFIITLREGGMASNPPL